MLKKIFLLLLLLILIYFLTKTNFENFNAKNHHNCYPYSFVQNPSDSFESNLKGWCSTGESRSVPYPDDPSVYNQSNIKCPPNYSRTTADKSIDTDSKSWCVKP